jgi:hypothetical protein
LKKGEMAMKAQELLTGTGWLPEPLRTPGQNLSAPASATDTETAPIVDSELGPEQRRDLLEIVEYRYRRKHARHQPGSARPLA